METRLSGRVIVVDGRGRQRARVASMETRLSGRVIADHRDAADAAVTASMETRLSGRVIVAETGVSESTWKLRWRRGSAAA